MRTSSGAGTCSRRLPDTRAQQAVGASLGGAPRDATCALASACKPLIRKRLHSAARHRSRQPRRRRARGWRGHAEAGESVSNMVQSAKDRPENVLRVGVVGVGVMGSNHARGSGHPSGRPAGRHRRSGSAAGAVRRQRARDARRSTSVEALLPLGVDAVTIAAPTHLHHDIALACIRRGIHVLVEKPIASNPDEGRSIVAAARRAGVTLMVGHVERFNPAVETIKEAIRGEDILSIAITRVGPFPPRMSNVGVVIDLAVHDIDLIRWFTDSEIVDVQPLHGERGGRARGHRAAAVPHHLRRAGADQHQLADPVQGAHGARRHARQVHHRRSARRGR